MVIPRPQVNLRILASPLELIKQVDNLSERILVLDCGFIELSVIIHILKDTSFFFTNKTEAVHGEILGLMKPFSSKSVSSAYSSFNSYGAIRYGEIEMGFVSGRKSIQKSISHSGGICKRQPFEIIFHDFTKEII